MEDIEIARNTKLKKITEIAEKLNIQEEQLEQYGKFKAKISPEVYKELKNKKDGKLILVTAINPTPLGEGKTTMAIGLADGLRKIGKKAVLALREPSLGPVFGIKGGATGGGHSQIAPMEDINLHFTGDIHAITSANNLLSAMIDNHIYFGNELEFDRVVWKRCVDLNDRQLRTVNTEDNKPITAKDLKADGAMTVLLKDAINPNLVQSLEQTPAIVHGGPFANIAHGCNSVIATKLALKLGEYVITEAGFGADLGAEKFLDIKCRKANLKPDAIVCVATIKALKYHGGMPKEDIKNESVEYLAKGFENLERHVDNLKNNYGLNVIVAINKYTHDTENEIKFLQNKLQEKGINLSLVESWEKGGEGAEDLAQKIVDLAQEPTNFKFAYELSESIESKIKAVAQKIYGAEDVEFTDKAKQHIEEIKKMGYENMPVCIAKTQYSFSDDPKNLECKEPFTIHVQDVVLRAGAEFIVVLTGKIMTMPGLPKVPSAESIDLDENGNIVGIF